MANKWSQIALSCIIFFGGCVDREPEPTGDPKGFAGVRIDEKIGKKILHFNRNFYVGTIGAHGWIGWVTYEYNITLPLGKVRNVVNPFLNGPDIDGETFGYIIFDENKQEITIRMRQVHFAQEGTYDPAYGGGPGSLEIVGESELELNGTYRVDDPTAFK